MSKSVLVFINPNSSSGKSIEIFNKNLKPVLEQKNINFTPIITKYRGHGESVVKEYDLTKINGIITISGDGLIYEIINGLKTRSDWDEVSEKIPLGVLPGGMSCAIHWCIMEDFNLLNAPKGGKLSPLTIAIKNATEGVEMESTFDVDLIEIETPEKTMVSAMGATIGLIGDSDIASEEMFGISMRWMGYLRVQLHALYLLLCPKSYHIRISYLPLESDVKTTKPIPPGKGEKIYLPPLSEPVPEHWETIEDKYSIVYALNVKRITSDNVVAQKCKLGDGIIWLMLIKGSMTRYELLHYLLNGENGPNYDHSPNMNMVPVRAFRFEPKPRPNGIIAVDGESIPFGNIQGQILPQKMKMFINPDSFSNKRVAEKQH